MSAEPRVRPGTASVRAVPLLGAVLACLLLVSGCANTPYDRGRRALDAGDPATALQEFNLALSEGTRIFESTRERGAAQLAAGNLDAALVDLEHARQLEANDRRLLWLLGQAYSESGRPADAAEAYRGYEALATNRRTRSQTQLRIAQLENEVAEVGAAALLEQRRAGVEPESNSVAVYSFKPKDGEDAPLKDEKICRALNIWVSSDLAKVAGVQAIAADQLDIIYAEQNFTYENRQYFQPSSLVVAGNLQPSRHMVQGIYGSQPDATVAMGAACFDATSNSTQVCGDGLDGPMTDLFDLETELVFAILDAMGIVPTAEERLAIGEKPTRNLQAFLAYADGVYLMDIGNLQEAIEAFRQASLIDPGFKIAEKAAAKAQVDGMPSQQPVAVSAPAPPATAESRAMTSTMQLGLGLIPDVGGGDGTSGTTNDITTTRGDVSLRIRAETR